MLGCHCALFNATLSTVNVCFALGMLHVTSHLHDHMHGVACFHTLLIQCLTKQQQGTNGSMIDSAAMSQACQYKVQTNSTRCTIWFTPTEQTSKLKTETCLLGTCYLVVQHGFAFKDQSDLIFVHTGLLSQHLFHFHHAVSDMYNAEFCKRSECVVREEANRAKM